MTRDLSILEMCPVIIRGTDNTGKWYEEYHCSSKDINFTINHYRLKNPKVVHVEINVALPEMGR